MRRGSVEKDQLALIIVRIARYNILLAFRKWSSVNETGWAVIPEKIRMSLVEIPVSTGSNHIPAEIQSCATQSNTKDPPMQ